MSETFRRLRCCKVIALFVAGVSCVVIGLLVAGYGQADTWPQQVTWPALPKVIAGKPYSVSPGPQQGTFAVKWGDDSTVWKPMPWMEDKYKQMGPAFRSMWVVKGLPYPYDVPIEQRDKLGAEDLMDRCSANMLIGPGNSNGWDQWQLVLHTPNGGVRETGTFFEFYSSFVDGKNQEYLSSNERGKVRIKYIWEAASPEEFRGQGGVTTEPFSPDLESEDTWYNPQVRKIRRLAGAVSKQFFPGTIYRYEDVSHQRALPELSYKVVGFELAKQHTDWMEFGPNDLPNSKRVDPSGDVNVIIQITPKPGVSWWYTKRLYYCGLLNMTLNHSEEFDANGKLIRRLTHCLYTGSAIHVGTADGPAAPEWEALWGSASVYDYLSGFSMDGYITTGGVDATVPTTMFGPSTLFRQPMALSEWIQK